MSVSLTNKYANRKETQNPKTACKHKTGCKLKGDCHHYQNIAAAGHCRFQVYMNSNPLLHASHWPSHQNAHHYCYINGSHLTVHKVKSPFLRANQLCIMHNNTVCVQSESYQILLWPYNYLALQFERSILHLQHCAQSTHITHTQLPLRQE